MKSGPLLPCLWTEAWLGQGRNSGLSWRYSVIPITQWYASTDPWPTLCHNHESRLTPENPVAIRVKHVIYRCSWLNLYNQIVLSYFPQLLLNTTFCNLSAARIICQCYSRWKCWAFDPNKAITVSHPGPPSVPVLILFVSDDCDENDATWILRHQVGVILYLCCAWLLPDISLRLSLSLSLSRRFAPCLKNFLLVSTWIESLVATKSVTAGASESEKWNQAEYRAVSCPPLLKFLMNKSQDCGIGFVSTIWSGSTGKKEPPYNTFWQALECIPPTCKVMHSNQHFLKFASGSLEGRGGKVSYFSLAELETLWLVARIDRIEFTDWTKWEPGQPTLEEAECFMARRGPGEIVAF